MGDALSIHKNTLLDFAELFLQAFISILVRFLALMRTIFVCQCLVAVSDAAAVTFLRPAFVIGRLVEFEITLSVGKLIAKEAILLLGLFDFKDEELLDRDL